MVQQQLTWDSPEVACNSWPPWEVSWMPLEGNSGSHWQTGSAFQSCPGGFLRCKEMLSVASRGSSKALQPWTQDLQILNPSIKRVHCSSVMWGWTFLMLFFHWKSFPFQKLLWKLPQDALLRLHLCQARSGLIQPLYHPRKCQPSLAGAAAREGRGKGQGLWGRLPCGCTGLGSVVEPESVT